MPARRRSLTPPDRRLSHPRHPTGRARRRWPRAYDGGAPERPANRRYRGDFETERRARRRRSRRPLALETLRQSPVRNGLIGLAVAGAAAPIAVSRYQTALRNDPSHERISTRPFGAEEVDAEEISNAWRSLESARSSAELQREQVIQRNLERHADMALDRRLAEDIYDMAREANVDPDIAFGLVRAESSFKNTATSRVGAVGLTQLMPRTAAWLEPGTTRSDLRDPETNLRIGFRYLRDLIDKYDGNVDLALTAYNRGPGTVDGVLRRGGNPDNGYAGFVKTGEIGRHKG